MPRFVTKTFCMLRQLLLLFPLLLIFLFPFSQDHHESPDYLTAYRSAEKYYNSARPTEATDSFAFGYYQKTISFLVGKKINAGILFDSYLKSGIIKMSEKKDQQALEMFLGAIQVGEMPSGLADSVLFTPYLFAGSSYYNLNDLDSADFYYKKAEALIDTHPSLTESERLYNKYGALFYETGDYKKSIQYFRKALSIVEKNHSANPYFIVNYKNNIASAMRKLGQYDQAMDLYKSLLPYHINSNELLHNIGVTYLDESNYSEAVHYLGKVSYGNQVKYNDIGHAYLQLKKYDSSIFYLNEAETEYRKTISKQKSIDHGITLKYRGDLMMAMNDPLRAIHYYQQAIIEMDPDFNDTSINKNPLSFPGLHNSFLLFDALTAKGAAFESIIKSDKDSATILSSLSSYASGIELAREVEKRFNSDEARLFLGKNVTDAYKQVIGLAIRMFDLSHNKIYLKKAFSYAEESKASVLQSSLHELSLESIEGMPKNLIRQEKYLKALITKMNIELGSLTDSQSIKTIGQKINDFGIRLSVVQEKLDRDPKYHQLKFDSKGISMDSIQDKMLPGDAALISFYYLKNKLICFFITNDEIGYVDCGLPEDLQKNILSLREILQPAEGQRKKSTEETGSALFQQLLQPVFEKIKNKKRLVIIPHNDISYVPFEVLADPSKHELLIKKFAISYNYSANFLTRNEKTFDHPFETLAMAPFSGPSTGNTNVNLKSSREEIESLKGKILFGQDATKQNFLQFSGEYPVIHLATHAEANDIDPLRSYINFYGGNDLSDTAHRLFEQEIYHLDMKSARLVILSACETGAGQLVNGEGIMSLSRAFSYAGCKSVITSLWKADDRATAFICKRLHIYLQKGLEKDRALQKAKLDYLESNEIDASQKSPAYWAHLIVIGNAQAIGKKTGGWLWIAGIAILLWFLMRIIGRNRRLK